MGHVVRGDARGRLLGYPTLNVALPEPRKLLPPAGVYAVRVADAAGAHRSSAMGLFNLAYLLGAAFGPAIAALL